MTEGYDPEDVTNFTDLEGVTTTIEDIVDKMISYYYEAFDEGTTQINDFNEGSEVRNLLEAIASSIYELRLNQDNLYRQSFPQTAFGGYLDLLGVMVDCTRHDGTAATGTITVTGEEGRIANIIIPAGTIIYTDDEEQQEFTTTSERILLSTETSKEIPVKAVDMGESGNILANVLTEMEEPIDYIEITASTAMTNGTEPEDDESYRARIIAAGKGTSVGTTAWFKTEAEKIEGVHDVYIDNLNPGDYTAKIIVNPPTPSIVAAVTEIFQNPENEIAGVDIICVGAIQDTREVTIQIEVQEGYVYENVSADVLENIQKFFVGGTPTYNSSIKLAGLNINETLIASQFRAVVNNTEGVNDYVVSAPSVNVDPPNQHVITYGTIIITEMT